MRYIISSGAADGSYTNLGDPISDRGTAMSSAADASSGGGAEIAVLEDDGGDVLLEIARYADGRALEPDDEIERASVHFKTPAKT